MTNKSKSICIRELRTVSAWVRGSAYQQKENVITAQYKTTNMKKRRYHIMNKKEKINRTISFYSFHCSSKGILKIFPIHATMMPPNK